ncbi:hypothetical protein SAMN05421690_104012 [Nitrosomonas sp. Nm51]|uniref:hypothetical protein n=1 Tax=Nitrosomonas sp. Nm51 TaxID=133720 RepID=UPI0008D01A1E|nr:hypothetical protein [Nitrosomonas sp. Nm51]SER58143.1 hypothetical protein SAMN05421690_104012 [Nitrosomonas sp. Nm51]
MKNISTILIIGFLTFFLSAQVNANSAGKSLKHALDAEKAQMAHSHHYMKMQMNYIEKAASEQADMNHPPDERAEKARHMKKTVEGWKERFEEHARGI